MNITTHFLVLFFIPIPQHTTRKNACVIIGSNCVFLKLHDVRIYVAGHYIKLLTTTCVISTKKYYS
jgi:hypothetical protein